ncbi:LuxR C-terminal-related transcriptional regulator [Streptomyces sp. NPDC090127]|uniref:helix-turn-helix transcriptional regulator n=1 Tax=Streptomyces sp. NPDC090127 TaxID=3365953 RepID=UPI003800CA79
MRGATTSAAAQRLYDRTSELAAVAALSARAADGTGGVLLVAGGPGMGRTALLDRAVRDSASRAHRVAAPTGNRVPWSGVRALLSALASTPSAARRALRVARGPEGLAGALTGLRAGEPLLLCLDDHHLWDAHSRAALDAVWRAGPAPWAWVVSSAGHHRPPEVPGARLLRLARLSRESASALLDDLCPQPLAASARTRLLDAARGHPGVLAAMTARLSTARASTGSDLPASVTADEVLTEVYRGLLDSLPAACGRVLTLTAIAGEASRREAEPEDVRLAVVGHDDVRPVAVGHDEVGRAAVGCDDARPAAVGHDEVGRAAVGCDDGRPVAARSDEVGRAAVGCDDGRPVAARSDEVRPAAVGHDDVRPVDPRAVLAAARAVRASTEALHRLIADGLVRETREGLRFADPLLRRAVLGAVQPARREELRALFVPPAEVASVAPPRTAAAPTDAALARGAGHRAHRLRATEEVRALSRVVRGRAEFARGLAGLADGPVGDAHHVLLLAASLLRDGAPEEAADARFLAMEAAWAAGDPDACAAALGGTAGGVDLAAVAAATAVTAVTDVADPADAADTTDPADPAGEAGPGPADEADAAERDFRDGMCAALALRLHEARGPLARVVARDGAADEPRHLLRAGAAALVLGDAQAAVRVHARALAKVRAEGRTALLPKVLEHLSYAELRAGRHDRAAAHAREGLRTAESMGQRNVAAHQHAVLALAASVAGDARAVAEHAGRALVTARPHGLVQATTLAEWSLARAELGSGLAAQAAARLAPLVGPGPRSGHFALRMLAVPCFVEAACAAGRAADARAATEEFAVWAGLGLDPQAPAQLARCRALLAGSDDSARWYGEAVRHHEETGNDFERARTLLAYGKWLRRRRRPVEARGPLSDALVTFERAAAGIWADQARAELRATGGAASRPGWAGRSGRSDLSGAAGAESGAGASGDAGAVAELTPQQQRIARLVAAGATNREIADRLSLSPRTVDHHLRNVFVRLGVRSRVELSGLFTHETGGTRDARAGRGGRFGYRPRLGGD